MLTLTDLNFQGKTVFLRIDFNVPLEKNLQIRDDSRIRAALPTINFLLENQARVIAASHLGRPKGKIVPELSLKPVAQRLSELISQQVLFAPDVVGENAAQMKSELEFGQLLLLENLRYLAEEKANDSGFAQQLAEGVDYYINDAFGTCHRSHASVVAITQYVDKSAAGFLVKKEMEYLQKIVRNPEKPYVAILGGAKVSDKIPVITNLMNKADDILIGGAMAYTFFAAQGLDVGRSLVEEDKMELALQLLENARQKGVKLMLPSDHITAQAIEANVDTAVVNSFPIPTGDMALDIGPSTVKSYAERIGNANTLFWNGPLGVFEVEQFAQGTKSIAEAVANSSALSIVGGGDSVAAIYAAGVQDKISHISTGGGASLEFIANETLPGIEALSEE